MNQFNSISLTFFWRWEFTTGASARRSQPGASSFHLSTTYCCRSNDTTKKWIHSLWPQVFWYQVHLWPTLLFCGCNDEHKSLWQHTGSDHVPCCAPPGFSIITLKSPRRTMESLGKTPTRPHTQIWLQGQTVRASKRVWEKCCFLKMLIDWSPSKKMANKEVWSYLIRER